MNVIKDIKNISTLWRVFVIKLERMVLKFYAPPKARILSRNPVNLTLEPLSR